MGRNLREIMDIITPSVVKGNSAQHMLIKLINEYMNVVPWYDTENFVCTYTIICDSVRKHWCSKSAIHLKQCLNEEKDHKIPHIDLFSSFRLVLCIARILVSVHSFFRNLTSGYHRKKTVQVVFFYYHCALNQENTE